MMAMPTMAKPLKIPCVKYWFAMACSTFKPKAVHRVIGDGERLGLVLEGRDGDDRAEDFLLEDPHLVVALQDGRLDVVSLRQIRVEARCIATDEHPRAFFAGFYNPVRRHSSLGFLRPIAFERKAREVS